ncbi:MAG: methyltransferase domain-containing protein, partial [Chthoniobacterales bacterium]
EVDLRNLRQLNRYFGSYCLVRHFASQWIRAGENLRVLDMATGSGDIPRLLIDHARTVGARVEVIAIDQQASTVEIARRLSTDYPEIHFEQGDVFTFGKPGDFDLVLCSLALHHFSEDAAIRLLRRCRALSRRFVLVSDLRRGFLATVGIYLLTLLVYRERMTQIDGRLSARRAFSYSEMRQLAERAGWGNFGHRNFPFARQAVWLASLVP